MNHETDDQPLHHDATLTPAQPIPPTPSTLRRIFIGKDGLRADWSLLIFIALFAALIFSVNAIGRKLYPPAPNTANATTEISPQRGFIFESIPLLIALLVTWIMSKIERRPNSVYGFGGRRKLPRFLAGLASGIICLSILILALVKTGFLVIDSRLLFGGNILRYGAIWRLGFLLVGLQEEYLTRGYVQYTLTRGLAGLYQWAFKTQSHPTLGRYTHRVAISNHRLLAFDQERVTFRWKDYAHGGKQGKMKLAATEFLRRFLLPLGPIPTTAVQQFLRAGRSWNLQSFGGEFFCLALPTLRRDHDRGSEIYGCGIIYMHLLRFVVALASLLLLRCAPAHRRIRVPTPRRHAAVPPSAHTSAGICDALSHHHATGPVHQCSPGARFCDRLPFKSHSAPRPPQTPAASS